MSAETKKKKLGLPAHENTDPGDGDGGVHVSDIPRRGGPDRLTVAPARRTTVVLNICGAYASCRGARVLSSPLPPSRNLDAAV